MNILAFGGSTSTISINKQLATYCAQLFTQDTVKVLDLNDFKLPIYSYDEEAANGHPEAAKQFLQHIGSADLLVISLAEHNGSYSAAFKNLFDWASRVESKTFQDKPMILMATSPGARGGMSVLEAAKTRFPFHATQILATFSLPEFYKNFDAEQGITNEEFRLQLENIVLSVKEQLS